VDEICGSGLSQIGFQYAYYSKQSWRKGFEGVINSTHGGALCDKLPASMQCFGRERCSRLVRLQSDERARKHPLKDQEQTPAASGVLVVLDGQGCVVWQRNRS